MIDGRDVIMQSVLGEQLTGWTSLLTQARVQGGGGGGQGAWAPPSYILLLF